MVLQWLPCKASGVIGSAVGLVVALSVCLDNKSTSTSVWQHVNLSEQIGRWDTLACCWNVKQPTTATTGFANTTSLSPIESSRLVGRVVKASVFRAADLGSIPAFAVDLFPGRVIPMTSTLALPRLPCQVPGAIGSALGLVGMVSV